MEIIIVLGITALTTPLLISIGFAVEKWLRKACPELVGIEPNYPPKAFTGVKLRPRQTVKQCRPTLRAPSWINVLPAAFLLQLLVSTGPAQGLVEPIDSFETEDADPNWEHDLSQTPPLTGFDLSGFKYPRAKEEQKL